jgi:hypothetical protein
MTTPKWIQSLIVSGTLLLTVLLARLICPD